MAEAARVIHTDDGMVGRLDDQDRLVIDTPDGGTIYRVHWREKQSGSSKFGDNLALTMSDVSLYALADDLIREIEADDLSRRDYMETLARAIEMLGIRVEDGRTAENDSSAPLEGMSTFRHPLLLQSAIRFQADFVAELLPADGPVKIRDDSPEPPAGVPGMDNMPPELPGITSADLADALQKDFNHYLIKTASEYYPDTTRMAFQIGLKGGGFKKVYHCPLRKRPVSESIDVGDLIVDHSATDLRNAARVTHRIKMRNSIVRRMMKAKIYRDVPLGQPMEKQNPLEQAVSTATGIAFINMLPSDHQHTIYECATERDIEEDGDYRPYKITVDKDSRQVLSIYRNWAEKDKLKLARCEIVKYCYLDALGFYPLGLVHVLGNTVRALTAAFREFLDAGMFANFPGFLYSDEMGKQLTNQFRVAPGSGVPIKTGGKPIAEGIMPLPYKTPDSSFMAFIQHMEESGRALGGEASVPLSEGTSNMPVGTMLAQIEQTLKPIKGVFKGLHRSQAEEFQLLKQRFREDPGALWRYNEKPARQWEEEEFLAALDDADLVPMADPNTASQVQRIAIAWAMLELAKTAPWLFKDRDTALRFMRMIGVPDPEGIMNSVEEARAAKAAMQPPGGGKASNPALDAAKAQEAQAGAGLKQAQAAVAVQKAQTEGATTAAELQEKAAERQFRAAEMLAEAQERDADRASHLTIAHTNQETARLKTGADLATVGAKTHAEAVDAHAARGHEAGIEAANLTHEHVQNVMDREHEVRLEAERRSHEAGLAEKQAGVQAEQSDAQRAHEVKVAGMAAKKESKK